jgi:hypothetical protein
LIIAYRAIVLDFVDFVNVDYPIASIAAITTDAIAHANGPSAATATTCGDSTIATVASIG